MLEHFNINDYVDELGMKIGEYLLNIHIYPLICEILGIPAHKDIDGNIDEVRMMLR